MTKETLKWLNNNILIGYTDQRGPAWHDVEKLKGDESNNYPGAIPVDDVVRRLFDWEAVAVHLYEKVVCDPAEADFIDKDGRPVQIVLDEGVKKIVHPVTRKRFRNAGRDYVIHQYPDWLLNAVKDIIDDDINIGSAGLLRGGGVAFVTIEVPETIEIIEGFGVRPHLLASTSHNGQLATSYKTVATFVVCDNTLAMALREKTPQFTVKHTRYSQLRLQTARDALQIVHRMTDEVRALVTELSELKVSTSEWNRLLDELAPIPDRTKEPNNEKLVEKARTKQAEIRNLYDNDKRVAPWRGSGLGVLQAFNTHRQQVAGKNKGRRERNMLHTLGRVTRREDTKVLAALGIRGR
jgi:phage/plasmid-like protein (TIGR03299 family)